MVARRRTRGRIAKRLKPQARVARRSARAQRKDSCHAEGRNTARVALYRIQRRILYYLSRLLLVTPPGRSAVLQRRRALYGSMACPGGLVSGTILASTWHAHTELQQLAEIAKFGSGAFLRVVVVGTRAVQPARHFDGCRAHAARHQARADRCQPKIRVSKGCRDAPA